MNQLVPIGCARAGGGTLLFRIFAIISRKSFAEGDLVAVWTTFTGTHGGLFRFESLNLGKSLCIVEMFFFRVVDRKVAEILRERLERIEVR
jgi:hypothetical protein